MFGFVLLWTRLDIYGGCEDGPEEQAEGEEEEDPLYHGHSPGHHERSGITDQK